MLLIFLITNNLYVTKMWMVHQGAKPLLILTDSLVGFGGDQDETQLPITGSQFLETDYMQNVLLQNDAAEKAAKDANPPAQVPVGF
jgi:hypothetical protein